MPPAREKNMPRTNRHEEHGEHCKFVAEGAFCYKKDQGESQDSSDLHWQPDHNGLKTPNCDKWYQQVAVQRVLLLTERNEVRGIRNAVSVNAIFVYVIGIHADGCFVNVDSRRQFSVFPRSREYS